MLTLLLLQLMMASSSNWQRWGNPNGGEEASSAESGGRRCLHVRLHSVTAFGQKAWSYLHVMPEAGRPDIIAATETHLKGVHLNRVRRRATSLGWHFLVLLQFLRRL